MKAPSFLHRSPAEMAKVHSPVWEAQRRTYNEHVGLHYENARNWKWIAFGCMAISLTCVGGMIHVANLPRITPFVVAMNHLGDEVAVMRADLSPPVNQAVLEGQLARWVRDIRSVITDATEERHNVFEAYDMTDQKGPAYDELNDWFRANDPFRRAASEIDAVTVTAVIPTVAHHWQSWRVEWKEEIRSRTGELEATKFFEANLTVSITPPTTETEILKNPSGLFVESFSWGPRTSRLS